MPKIFASSLADNHEQVRCALVFALEKCMGRKPYDQITLADVAAEAGIARNTIYNYARDKAALTEDAAAFAGKTLLDQVHAIATDGRAVEDRLAGMIGVTVNWVANSQYRSIILHAIIGVSALNPRTSFPLQKSLIEQSDKLIAEGIALGAFRSDLSTTMLLLPGIMQAAVAAAFNSPQDKEAIGNEAFRMILAVLRP